jgi:glycosyltransferase involved in cell wall biosynthesis
VRVAKRQRLAIVVQRYGEEVNGGAELHARWLAERLAETDEVRVLTTCALDYRTWDAHYPAGETALNGVTVHRFPVDAPRDWAKTQRQTARLFTYPRTLYDEVRWIQAQGPYSTPLLQAISENYTAIDTFIFFTFHYATTYFGLQLVSDKAVLVPTAHEDPFLGLSAYRPVFHLPRGIAYNTISEQELVQRTVHNEHVPSRIAGVGVTAPDDIAAERFRSTYGLHDPFLLYVGRIDESKNVPELLAYFRRFREDTAADGAPLKLVLLGKSHIPLPDDPDIVALGFVSDEVKYDAIRAAEAVVLPSIYESLSLITLESWAVGTPVLVNGRCDVVKRLAKESNGGLYYHSYEEFVGALATLLGSAELRTRLGRQGQRFVSTHYTPEVVMAKYRDLLENGSR